MADMRLQGFLGSDIGSMVGVFLDVSILSPASALGCFYLSETRRRVHETGEKAGVVHRQPFVLRS
jgi:hypothetical protein